jgi:hypothetical protein
VGDEDPVLPAIDILEELPGEECVEEEPTSNEGESDATPVRRAMLPSVQELTHIVECGNCGVASPLSLVKPLANMGMADVAAQRNTNRLEPAQHAKFLNHWHITEKGDCTTATRRSYVLQEALKEAPEITSPDLNIR